MEMKPIVVVGAGLAGLSCAVTLSAQGKRVVVLEQDSAVGGRMRTDVVDGFRLDRGFHVMQTAYPEAQELLDFEALNLKKLEPGALIRKDGAWVRMSDPLRRPRHAFSTVVNPIGSLSDRWKLMRLRRDVSHQSATVSTENDCATMDLFRDHYRFSDAFIEGFLRPWWAGIFLETELATSANFMRFIFKMLASSPIVYPAAGIQAIPEQLSAKLPLDSVRLNAPVSRIDGHEVTLESGEVLEASNVIVALPMEVARRLLGESEMPGRSSTATSCLYYSALQAPCVEPILMLNGDGVHRHPINHVFVLSNASTQVAPDGHCLISVTLVGQNCTATEDDVQSQLSEWFGAQVQRWAFLRRYDIPHALPSQPSGFNKDSIGHMTISGGVLCCGDYQCDASVNGAIKSGRLAAEALLRGKV